MSKTASAPVGCDEVVLIEPKLVQPHPQNPRVNIEGDPRTAELEGLIREHGQTTPALVRPITPQQAGGARFELVLGHRRWVVARRLERPLKAVVEELDDEAALVRMLADAGSHLAPDPFLESEAIASLVAKDGWTLERAATALGKTRRWVAHRAKLRDLIHSMRTAVAQPGSSAEQWPPEHRVEWLAEIAALGTEVQEEIAKRIVSHHFWARDEREFQTALGRELNVLSKAPWKLEDANVIPVVGACVSCPKVSSRVPGLFGDDDLAEAGGDPKKARCLDRACWDRKTRAHVAATAAELRANDEKVVFVQPQGGMRSAYGAPILPEGVKKTEVLEAWETTPAKKGTKGAVKAIALCGPEAGKVSYVVPRPSSSRSSGAAKPKPKKDKSPEAKRREEVKAIDERRLNHVYDAFAKALPKLDPPLEVVMALAVAYGIDPPMDVWEAKDRPTLLKKYSNGNAWRTEVWTRIAEGGVADEIAGSWRPMAKRIDDATWLAEVLEFNLGPLEAKAAKAIPDPKWLKRGVCRGCGASGTPPSGDRAKTWVEVDLCSGCAGAKPAGKKPGAAKSEETRKAGRKAAAKVARHGPQAGSR